MNSKNRKKMLNILLKEGFLDQTKLPDNYDAIFNDPTLGTIQDPNELMHQIFLKMLSQIDEGMKTITSEIDKK
jgi:ribosomal protein S8